MRKNEEKKTFWRVKVKFQHFSFIQAYKMLFGKHLYLCLIFFFFLLYTPSLKPAFMWSCRVFMFGMCRDQCRAQRCLSGHIKAWHKVDARSSHLMTCGTMLTHNKSLPHRETVQQYSFWCEAGGKVKKKSDGRVWQSAGFNIIPQHLSCVFPTSVKCGFCCGGAGILKTPRLFAQAARRNNKSQGAEFNLHLRLFALALGGCLSGGCRRQRAAPSPQTDFRGSLEPPERF